MLVDELAGRAARRHLSLARGPRPGRTRRGQGAARWRTRSAQRMIASPASRSTCGLQRLKSTAQRDTIVKAFLDSQRHIIGRGALQRGPPAQSAHRLRHRLPHDEAAHRVRRGGRAALPRRRGALRERREEAPRPPDLRALRQDRRVRGAAHRERCRKRPPSASASSSPATRWSSTASAATAAVARPAARRQLTPRRLLIFGLTSRAGIVENDFQYRPMCCRPSLSAPVCALRGGAAPGVLAARAAVVTTAPAAADIRRALTLLNVVGEEYREGVVDGQVVLPIEYGEASAFLDEARVASARRRARRRRPPTAGQFAQARAAIGAKAPTEQVRGQLDALRAAIIDPHRHQRAGLPARRAVGRRAAAPCSPITASPCHGDRRRRSSDPHAARAQAAARPTSPMRQFMRGETPFDFFHVISARQGPTGAMPAWGDVLSLQDRWDLVSYLWTVAGTPAHFAEGQGVYLSACAGCHGATGDGRGRLRVALPRAGRRRSTIRQPWRARATPTSARVVADGAPGTAMPGFAGRLSDAQMRRRGRLRPPAVARRRRRQPTPWRRRRRGDALRRAADPARRRVPEGRARRRQPVGEQELARERDPARAGAAPGAARPERRWRQRDAGRRRSTGRRGRSRLGDAIARRAPAVDVVAATGRAEQTARGALPHGRGGRAGKRARRAGPGAAPARRRRWRRTGLAIRAPSTASPTRTSCSIRSRSRWRCRTRALARSIEGRFAELRGVMAQPGREAEAAALGDGDGQADLDDRAHRRSRRAISSASLAFQSAFIILREGFEVVLIVGALLAYATQSGQQGDAPADSLGRRRRRRRQPAHGVGASCELFERHRRHRRGARGRDDAARRRRCCSSSATG